jgi:hypothetical protein
MYAADGALLLIKLPGRDSAIVEKEPDFPSAEIMHPRRTSGSLSRKQPKVARRIGRPCRYRSAAARIENGFWLPVRKEPKSGMSTNVEYYHHLKITVNFRFGESLFIYLCIVEIKVIFSCLFYQMIKLFTSSGENQ